MFFFGKKNNNKPDSICNEESIEEAGQFLIKIPKGYMSKYIPPSEADRVVADNGRIRGSCVVYDQIEKPAKKKDKLEAVFAVIGTEKLINEKGICQYLFPVLKGKSMDIGLEICDFNLKPNWVYPFTGTGFMPNMALLYYLTRELEPDDGHILFYFDDDGSVETTYVYSASTGTWAKADALFFVSEKEKTSIEKDEWENLIRLSQREEGVNRDIAMWGALMKLPCWYGIKRTRLANGVVVPYLGDDNGVPMVALFTSESLADDFMKLVGIDEKDCEDPIIEYPIPSSLQTLMDLKEHGVTKLIFNMGVTEMGFYGLLTSLMEVYQWFKANDPRFAENKDG